MAGREKNCKWYFADQPNGQEVGPNNAMEQSFRQHPYSSLVRESIQNSLDAVLDKNEPVKVVYSFKEMNGADYPNFFELQSHISGCIDYFCNNRNAKAIYTPMLKLFSGIRFQEHLCYIRVSDYNTKGMEYDESKTDSPFYAFVRSAGVSAKENASAGGSFGFGKAAYYLLSPISTILVSTCTEKYAKCFEGISSLCTHLFNGTKKMAVGFYDDRNGRPIVNEEDIPVKFRRSEPGTDINILGFDMQYAEEAIREMVEAVLRNFWMAIYNKKLIVSVEEIEINKDNIVALMEEYFPDADDSTRKAGYYNPRPYFDSVHLCGTSNKYILKQEELPILGHVMLYINKQKNATDKIVYHRASQMLIYGKRTRTNYGLYGVFYCDSDKGNDLLRNMENPAHDEWKASNWRVNGRACSMGRIALQELEDFVSRNMSEVFVSKDRTVINIKGLEEFLFIPTEYDDDEELESESYVGEPTGSLSEDGTSFTTDIQNTDDNPTIYNVSGSASTGHIMINRPDKATNSNDGNLHSGNGEQRRKTKNKGIQKPGDAKDIRKEDESGETGLFAKPFDVNYRTFSQIENGKTYHYVVLHSEEEISNVRIHFYAVGEDSDVELKIDETDNGNTSGNIIRDIHLNRGRTKLRVRFADNMKHTIKLTAEELYEL